MDKRTRMILLLDYYGALLTEHRSGLLEQYFSEDCSLAEIAEREGVSRQAVRDSLVRGEEQLEGFEAKLGFLARDISLAEAANGALLSVCGGDHEAAAAQLDILLRRLRSNDGI